MNKQVMMTMVTTTANPVLVTGTKLPRKSVTRMGTCVWMMCSQMT